VVLVDKKSPSGGMPEGQKLVQKNPPPKDGGLKSIKMSKSRMPQNEPTAAVFQICLLVSDSAIWYNTCRTHQRVVFHP
jgi:hypothetical protein